MCGIVGFVDFNLESSILDLKCMVSTLTHRGPNTQNQKLVKQKDYFLGFGHTRLSILDLSNEANQPMQLNEFEIVYNGEIYNYKEIRRDLIALGHSFKTSSDTEVILHAYKRWGKKAVHRFNGMFAFAIYNKKEQTLFLCKDRSGVKPLFVFKQNNLLMFASELKAFHKHPSFNKEINIDAVYSFFNFGYVQSPHCIFKYCFKIEAGEHITYNLTTKVEKKEKYWTLDSFYKKNKLNISYYEAKDTLKELFEKACLYRTVSDVPVGVFLSGGYDSTLVTAILQNCSAKPIKTFTIGFNQGNNEAPDAKKIANYLGTEHQEYYCSEKETQDLITKLPYYYDEPFADSSAIPTALVSFFAKKEVTVALSADGADEMFGGYPRYHEIPKKIQKYLSLPLLKNKDFGNIYNVLSNVISDNKEKHKHILNSLSKTLKSPKKDRHIKFCESMRVLPHFHTSKLLIDKHNFIGFETSKIDLLPMEQLMLTDFKFYLHNDILPKIDRATMMFSLEGREPLLDNTLLEYVAQLPLEYKYKEGVSKRILKDIVHDYVPKNMMNRPKAGFSVPILHWLNNDLSFYLDEYLTKEKFDNIYFINTNYALHLVERFKANKLYYKEIIWRLLMLMLWWEEWIKD